MRFLDLLAMSVNNLRRRKLRTALTVLGVIIGTASIIVMVSLGIGLKELNMELYASYGSLTSIDVYSPDRWGSSDSSSEPVHLTDDTIKELMRIPHVDTATPVLNSYLLLKQGVYEGQVNVMGVSRDYLEQIPIGEGSLPDPNSKELQLVVGNMVNQQFYNPKSRGGNSWGMGGETGPDIDFLNKPMFVIFDVDSYYQFQNGDTDGAVKRPKKYLIPTSGIVAGGEEWNQYSYSIYVDVELLKAQLKKVFGKNPIPNQPLNKKGKPYNYFVYDEIIVYADDMDHVMEVQKAIQDLGFQANSRMEWLEQSQQQSNMIQAVLGGIGAVSLFVAAIGIANTMMMSIYERTKEIGIIKVLGCDMGVIRNMFLIESGFIGFMGGVIGVALSYGISLAVNQLLGAGELLMGVEGDISRIPSWLILSAIGFAIFVGMAAGFFPSLRAMKLSPLAAIRNE